MKIYRALLLAILLLPLNFVAAEGIFEAGAASVDISPRSLPAIRNGGFLQSVWNRVDDPLHARCLVLSDGKETIAITIVDSCMFSTDICDAIKSRVADRIPLPRHRILISATHTHSAPSVMSYCLGTGRDQAYSEFVVPRVADVIETAFQKMQPAKMGWTSVDASDYTHCRRWITRSDRMGTDPFGQQSVRAMMHPGYLNPNYVGPAGPIDPQLSVLSIIAAKDDSPLCIMANFSMHYFGSRDGFSADYFGEVADLFESRIAEVSGKPGRDFVGIMSQGTSGDLHWMNYAQSRRSIRRTEYAQAVAEKALGVWQQIQHQSNVTLAMSESRLKLRRRVPDAARLAWAQAMNDKRGDRSPRNQPEVYAQQAQWIHENPEAEVVLQAIRIGEVGIAALPHEVYGITGLKIKQQSPLAKTFNLELANGAEGYIPPPEQHRLGGYTTWPARTAGLEVEAEPKIVDEVLSLLESVSGELRRPIVDSPSGYSRAVMNTDPIAFWRLDDIVSDRAIDATGKHHAIFDGGMALYLPGSGANEMGGASNRSVYFAGGNLQATISSLPSEYSVSMCFWNGLPMGVADPGALFSRGTNDRAETLSIIHGPQNLTTLEFRSSDFVKHLGKTALATKAWHHVTLVRTADAVTVFLDGQVALEGKCRTSANSSDNQNEMPGQLTFGNFDGKLDEIAVLDRKLTAEDAIKLYRATGLKAPKRPLPKHDP